MWRTLHDFGFLSAPSFVKFARPGLRMSPIAVVMILIFIAALLFSSKASAVMPGFGKKADLLWYATPGTIHRRAAITRKLSLMYCEMTSPETEQGFENVEKPQFPHSVFSVCRWND